MVIPKALTDGIRVKPMAKSGVTEPTDYTRKAILNMMLTETYNSSR